MSGMAPIQPVEVLPRVLTAKRSEPQAEADNDVVKESGLYAVPMLFFAVSCMEKQRFRIKRRINLHKFRIKRILLLFTVFPINKKAAFLL